MKQMYFFPAIFHEAEEGGYWVEFPDLPGCNTQGDNMNDAYKMAVEALGLMLEDMIEDNNIPTPSDVKQIQMDLNSYLVVVGFDYLEYKKRHASQSVKKTLSIPAWLNEEAIARGFNFSNILQEALKERLGIS